MDSNITLDNAHICLILICRLMNFGELKVCGFHHTAHGPHLASRATALMFGAEDAD